MSSDCVSELERVAVGNGRIVLVDRENWDARVAVEACKARTEDKKKEKTKTKSKCVQGLIPT